jgi:hypothetical protein
VLRVAFERWLDDADAGTFPQLVREALDEMEIFATRE